MSYLVNSGSVIRRPNATRDVIGALIAAPGHELHGWAIIRLTGRSGPTVYKVLERLHEQGLLAQRWEDLDETLTAEQRRPRRRFYRITDVAGASALLG